MDLFKVNLRLVKDKEKVMMKNYWYLFTISGLIVIAFSSIVPIQDKPYVCLIGMFLCISGAILTFTNGDNDEV